MLPSMLSDHALLKRRKVTKSHHQSIIVTNLKVFPQGKRLLKTKKRKKKKKKIMKNLKNSLNQHINGREPSQ